MGKKEEYVTDWALLKCSEGLLPMTLKVTSQSSRKVQGKKVATEMDHKPLVNIKPFGICKELTKSFPPAGIAKPCLPSTGSKWTKVNEDNKISGKHTLLGESTCKCKIGGTISIIHTTQVPLPSRGKVVDKSKGYNAEVEVPCHKYPQSANHIKKAQKDPTGDIFTYDPPGAEQNRRQLLPKMDSIPTIPGFDRDEWPAAMFREGGLGASIEHVADRDNRGSGSYISQSIKKLLGGKKARGKKVKIKVNCSIGCGMC